MKRSDMVSAARRGGLRRLGMVILAGLVVAACLSVSATAVHAEFLGNLLSITASSDAGTAETNIPLPDPLPNGQSPGYLQLSSPELFELRTDQGELIGTVGDLQIALDGDPLANISFTATAGGSDTTFSLSSAIVSFAAMTNPHAMASAEMTLTDNDGSGASIDVVSPNAGLFQAVYNGSATYAELLGSASFTGGASASTAEDTSGVIGASVSSIQGVWQFTLSAGDGTRGRGEFQVVPEPSSLLLVACAVGVGTVFFLRNRKRARQVSG
jgi:hypothetical protein